MVRFQELNGKVYLVIDDARIILRNFSGRANTYNREGVRNFGVIIDDPEFAQQMAADGWNVKTLRPRDGEEEGTHWLPVKVNYDPDRNGRRRPPKISIKTANNVIYYEEADVKNLDGADLTNIRIVINPSPWKSSDGKSGIAAYLRSMTAVLVDDGYFFDDGDSDESDVPFDV